MFKSHPGKVTKTYGYSHVSSRQQANFNIGLMKFGNLHEIFICILTYISHVFLSYHRVSRKQVRWHRAEKRKAQKKTMKTYHDHKEKY